MNSKRDSVNKIKGIGSVQQAGETVQLDLAAGDDVIEFEQLIAEAAYFRAEKRGFEPGNEIADWLDAETALKSRQESGETASNISS